jgi:hypothetical protein
MIDAAGNLSPWRAAVGVSALQDTMEVCAGCKSGFGAMQHLPNACCQLDRCNKVIDRASVCEMLLNTAQSGLTSFLAFNINVKREDIRLQFSIAFIRWLRGLKYCQSLSLHLA